MFAQHPILDSEDLTSDDYSWDFYKLLLIPSQTRLFAARVGSCRGVDFRTRRELLTKRLENLIDQYGAAFLRPSDELGAVIIPSAKRDIEKTRILWTDRGRLKTKIISPSAAQALRE
ncbi:MAG: hypothetical protein EOO72_02980 [Myxococcaceae bacterium]|nr:MAG: hypothetical protein EOO72_02980 [Myxococcaceae bacterium]